MTAHTLTYTPVLGRLSSLSSSIPSKNEPGGEEDKDDSEKTQDDDDGDSPGREAPVSGIRL